MATLDYSRPGTPAAERGPGPPVLRLLFAGPLIFAAVMVLAYPVALLLPFGWEFQVYGAEIPTSRVGEYGGHARLMIMAEGSGRGSRARVTGASIFYTGDSQAGDLSLQYAEFSFSGRQITCDFGFSADVRPLNGRVLRMLLQADGFDAAEAATVADAVVAELQGLAAGRLPPADSWNTFPRSGPVTIYRLGVIGSADMGVLAHLVWWPWYTPHCAFVTLVLWAWAGRAMVRRRRRKWAAELRGR